MLGQKVKNEKEEDLKTQKMNLKVLKKVVKQIRNGFKKQQLQLNEEKLKENVHPLLSQDVQVELKL